jgi:GNAT superfamily N-acetyltransferase
MARTIAYGPPDEARLVVQRLQGSLDAQEDEWHVAENLFNPDRLEWADEAVFLKDDEGVVVSLGLICKTHPCVVSYYTLPGHRRKGHGYAVLRACIDRIRQNNSDSSIFIEPTNQSVDNHIQKLPEDIRSGLRIM